LSFLIFVYIETNYQFTWQCLFEVKLWIHILEFASMTKIELFWVNNNSLKSLIIII